MINYCMIKNISWMNRNRVLNLGDLRFSVWKVNKKEFISVFIVSEYRVVEYS